MERPGQRLTPLDRRAAWILSRRLQGEFEDLRRRLELCIGNAERLAEYVRNELRPDPPKLDKKPWWELSRDELDARWVEARKFCLVRVYQADGRLPRGVEASHRLPRRAAAGGGSQGVQEGAS